MAANNNSTKDRSNSLQDPTVDFLARVMLRVGEIKEERQRKERRDFELEVAMIRSCYLTISIRNLSRRSARLPDITADEWDVDSEYLICPTA